MNFGKETKVTEVAPAGPGPKAILAGTDNCCGGQWSVRDPCAGAGVPSDEILERLRRNRENIEDKDRKWLSAPLAGLTHHIFEKHHAYVRAVIPRVRELSEKVKTRHGANHPELASIQETFESLAQEMIAHMQKEERILFPYINSLERASEGKETFEAPFFQTVRNPIQAMMGEHDAADKLARQIREASLGYALPPEACESYRQLYTLLDEFEADLHRHVYLENDILFPRAVELEMALV